MSFEFRIRATELGDLARDLAASVGAIVPVARGVQQDYARKVVAEAKRLVPVRTGDLKRSIGIVSGGESVRLGLTNVEIEAAMPYAGFVEFGTVYMAPRPYLRPAIRKYAASYRRDLINAAAETAVGSKRAGMRALRGRSVYRGGGALSAGKALGRISG